ncbi:MAG: hypothetical protein RLZ69_327 [Actinomycetota bacterium]
MGIKNENQFVRTEILEAFTENRRSGLGLLAEWIRTGQGSRNEEVINRGIHTLVTLTVGGVPLALVGNQETLGEHLTSQVHRLLVRSSRVTGGSHHDDSWRALSGI